MGWDVASLVGVGDWSGGPAGVDARVSVANMVERGYSALLTKTDAAPA